MQCAETLMKCGGKLEEQVSVWPEEERPNRQPGIRRQSRKAPVAAVCPIMSRSNLILGFRPVGPDPVAAHRLTSCSAATPSRLTTTLGSAVHAACSSIE